MEDGSAEIEVAREVASLDDAKDCAQISMAISLKRIANANETDTRDFFAGMALQGLLAGTVKHEDYAYAAYKYADLMMKARERK